MSAPRREPLDLADVARRLDGVLIDAIAVVHDALKRPLDRRDKADAQPVTAVDLAVDAFLREALEPLDPGAAWLSEESVDEDTRLTCERVWVVDPIDGTRSLLRGDPEYCVSVALVVAEGRGADRVWLPAAGGVANPSTGERYLAWRGGGAWERGRRIHVSTTRSVEQARVLVSRSEARSGRWRRFDGRMRMTSMGSLAYKLAKVAGGEFDAHGTMGGRNEWDVAAGHLIVHEAGGQVTDRAGRALLYNRPTPLFGGIVGSNGALHAAFVEVLREAEENSRG